MGSKDQRPKTRLGKSNPRRVKIITWAIGLLACGSGLYAAYHYTATTEVEVAVAPVRRGDFDVAPHLRLHLSSSLSQGRRTLRSRRLFVTTLTELSAIAALAMIGLSIRPVTG